MMIASLSPRTAGKTTNTGWLAHALAERGYTVECYDADHSRQLRSWADRGQWSIPVHLAASAHLHEEVAPAAGVLQLVDVGHSENHPHIARSALRAADLVIIHMSPTSGDWERVVRPPDAEATMDTLRSVGPLRADGRPPAARVLLNRTVAGATATGVYREQLTAHGYEVLSTHIPRREDYAQSIGLPVEGAAKTDFGRLVTELAATGLIPPAPSEGAR